MRELLNDNVLFEWQKPQEEAFTKLKNLCCKPPVLAFYNPKKPMEIQCDGSQHGPGAVLLQDEKPIASASRSLIKSEQRYAQIEKEMLSIALACSKSHCYILRSTVTVHHDNKTQVQIFKPPLLSAPMRLQRMLLNIEWYDLNAVYRAEKNTWNFLTHSPEHICQIRTRKFPSYTSSEA